MRAREFITEVGFRDLYPRAFTAFHDKYAPLAGRGDIYVNFTDAVGNVLDKSFSPKPNHADPRGLYAYPLDYVVNHPLDIAYGQQARYLRVVQDVSKNKVDLQRMTHEQAIGYLTKMGLAEPEKLMRFAARKVKNKPGAHFFFCVQYYTQVGQKHVHPNAVQTQLLLKAGIDTLEDTARNPVDAIIYPNEPEQIVFLTRSAFRVLEVFQLRPEEAGRAINYANRSEGLRRLPAMIARAIGDRLVNDATGGSKTPEQVYYTAAQRKIVVRMVDHFHYGHRQRGTQSTDRVEVRLLGPGFEPIVGIYDDPNMSFEDIAADMARRFEQREAGEGEAFDRETDFGPDVRHALWLYDQIAKKLKVEFTQPTSKEVAFRIWKMWRFLEESLSLRPAMPKEFAADVVPSAVERFLGSLKTRPPQADQIIAIYKAIAAKKGVAGYLRKLRAVANKLGLGDWAGLSKQVGGDDTKRVDLGEGVAVLRVGTDLHAEVNERQFPIAKIEEGKLTDWKDPSAGGWHDQTVMLPHAAAFAKYLNSNRFYIDGYHHHVAENYGVIYTDGQWKTMDDGVLSKEDIGDGFTIMMMPPDKDRDGHRTAVIRSNGWKSFDDFGPEWVGKKREWTELLILFYLNSKDEVVALGTEVKQTLDFKKNKAKNPTWYSEHPSYDHTSNKNGMIETFKRLDEIGFDVPTYIKEKGYKLSARLGEELRLFGKVANTDTGKIGDRYIDVLEPIGTFEGIDLYSVSPIRSSWEERLRVYCTVENDKIVEMVRTKPNPYDGKTDTDLAWVSDKLTREQRAAARALLDARSIRIPTKFAPLLRKTA